MKTTLFLMTQIFPYGKGETFLEAELPILAQQFDQIQIICENVDDPLTRVIPDNVVLHRFRPQLSTFQKVAAAKKLYKREIRKELKYIYEKQKSEDFVSCIKVLLDAVQQAELVTHFLSGLIEKNKSKDHKLIFYSYWLNNAALALAYLKNKYPSITCVSRAHRWDIYYDFHQPPYLPMKPYTLEQIDRVYSISEDGQVYLKKLSTDPRKSDIAISRLGVVNTLEFIQDETSTATETKLWIVSCSAMIPRKRLHLIMEALEYLPSSVKVLWQHIGDGPLMETLVEAGKAFQNKHENITIDFLGYMPNTEALQFYANNPIDLFINTSESEGIPVSIMEAMSFGIPCVGTEVGGVGEIIKTGKNGFLLPANPNASEVAFPLSKYNDLSLEQKNILRKKSYQTWVEDYNANTSYTSFAKDMLAI